MNWPLQHPARTEAAVEALSPEATPETVVPEAMPGTVAPEAMPGTVAPEAAPGTVAPEAAPGAVAPEAALDRAARRVEDFACAREPIHAPGAIQPHGRLLLLSPETGETLGAAVGSGGFGGAIPRLEDVLDPPSAARARAALRDESSPDPEPSGAAGEAGEPRAGARAMRLLEDLRGAEGERWAGLLHRSCDRGPAILELEPELDPSLRAGTARRVLGALNDAILRLREATTDADAAAVAAAAIRRMTGFERVMIYRFLPDWTGEVIAEDLAEAGTGGRIDSFRGLRFPASDIPEQARALYRRAGLRLIPDQRAAAIDLLVAPGAGIGPLAGADGLDLSRCVLRAVSPVHLAYLGNMGVRASMSVAIVGRDGALWGLVACHHQTAPRSVPFETRQAAETLGRALGWRLGELAEHRLLAAREAIRPLCERLAGRLAEPSESIGASLAAEGALLADATGSPFFAVVGLPEAAGPAPVAAARAAGVGGLALDAEALAGLAGALDRHGAAMLRTDRLDPGRLGEAGSRLGAAGVHGLLAIRLVEGRAGTGVWAVWFRGEVVREVVWAGDPDKAATPASTSTGAGAGADAAASASAPTSLSPRHSFAAWREQATACSAAFAASEIACGSTIADALQRGLLRRAGAVERANLELARRNDDIRFFADAAVHDLREPLWQVQVFAGMLHEELGASPLAAGNEDLPRMASVIEQSARRMRLLLDDLAAFAGAGRAEDLRPVRLDAIVADALADLEERIRHVGATVSLALGPVETVLCEPMQMQRVFQNLISNAIKYRAPARDVAIRIEAFREERVVRVRVSDDGMGFAPDEAALIFEPFRRLNRHSAAVSDGLGLGLAICRRIIEALGGTIEARGEVDRGARFDIVLPTVPM